jgi:hypothetical protein
MKVQVSFLGELIVEATVSVSPARTRRAGLRR